MYNFEEFFKVGAESGTTVLFIVLGLVQVWGRLGAAGKVQLLSSLATGLLVGGSFQIAALGTPALFSDWFAVVMYGLLMGLVASGVYEVGKKLATGAIVEIVKKLWSNSEPQG